MNLQTLSYGSQICLEDPGEPSTGEKRISVTAAEAELLAQLARDLTVMEVGTGLGVSTRALASTARLVVTHDTDPWVESHIWGTLPENVDILDDRQNSDVGFDMVFIDGEHTTEAVIEDLAFAREICAHGIIVMHDWKIPEVRAALDDTWALIDTHHGIAIKSVGL